MKWLIQDTHRLLNIVEKELLSLQKLEKEFSVFGVLENENILTGLYEEESCSNEKYIFRCGVKVINMISSGLIDEVSSSLLSRFKDGISYDFNNFDQRFYSLMDLPLLNKEATYNKFSDIKGIKFNKDMFIKPSSDLKCFTAGIIKAGTTIEEYILNSYYQKKYVDETILISEVKELGTEYRFVCIGDKAIAGSSYLQNGILNIYEKVDQNILNIASSFAKLYKPSDIFVMDLIRNGNDFKIIEYNCWNASGLYNIDMVKLFSDIESYKQ